MKHKQGAFGTGHIALGGRSLACLEYIDGIWEGWEVLFGIVLAKLFVVYHAMACHIFLAEIARDGYRKEKVAIHEWYLYIKAVGQCFSAATSVSSDDLCNLQVPDRQAHRVYTSTEMSFHSYQIRAQSTPAYPLASCLLRIPCLIRSYSHW
jgi:hypothetical protein